MSEEIKCKCCKDRNAYYKGYFIVVKKERKNLGNKRVKLTESIQNKEFCGVCKKCARRKYIRLTLALDFLFAAFFVLGFLNNSLCLMISAGLFFSIITVYNLIMMNPKTPKNIAAITSTAMMDNEYSYMALTKGVYRDSKQLARSLNLRSQLVKELFHVYLLSTK